MEFAIFQEQKEGLCRQKEIKEKAGGEPGPGQVGSCVPYKQSLFILTGVKTQRTVLSRSMMLSASLLLPWGL